MSQVFRSFLSIAICCFCSCDSFCQWSVCYSGANPVTSICFTNSLTGFATAGNSILKTIDGGNNWTETDFPNVLILLSIQFPTADTGYAVGTDGSILLTTNAGNDWTEIVTGISTWLYSVYFFNGHQGLVSAQGAIVISTSDCFQNYQSHFLPHPFDITKSLFFLNWDTGYVIGTNASGTGGVILKTDDHGNNWQSTNSGNATNQLFL